MPINLDTEPADIFAAVRLVRARPGDIVVLSGVDHAAHEATLKFMADALPEGVRCAVFEDEVKLDVLRPKHPEAFMRCDGLTCTGCRECIEP